MLIPAFLVVALWIVISVPAGLLLARAFKLEEGGVASASTSAHLERDRMDPALPVGAGMDRAGRADRFAQAG